MPEKCRWEQCTYMAEEGRFYCAIHPPLTTSKIKRDVRFGGGGSSGSGGGAGGSSGGAGGGSGSGGGGSSSGGGGGGGGR